MKFQNIKTIRKGLPCKVRVVNWSGDDLLTTYDRGDVATVEAANMDVSAFFNACVDEFSLKHGRVCRPNMFIRPIGEEFSIAPTDDKGHVVDLDLSLIEEVLIQPVPLSGG